MQRSNLIVVTLASLVIFLIGCSDPVVPGGRLVIRNDILDKEYNTFTIDSVVTSSGLQSFALILKPTEEKVLPYKNIREFRVIRQYRDHAKVYHVGCTDDLNTEVKMKLIDIHSNRLSGGCELRKKGRRSLSGVVTWEE